MVKSRWVSAILGAGVIAAGITAGTAWAGGPGGYVEDPEDIFAAVGTGEFIDTIAGFTATGDTSEEGLGGGDRRLPERGRCGVHR